MRRITELDNRYPGETLWAIGRGPSLEHLRAGDIGPGPVVAINQAIGPVEALPLPNPLFSMQKDVFFGAPSRAAILAHEREAVQRSRAELEAADAYTFDCETDFGLPWHVPSVVVCAALARWMGCARVVYLCCDAVTDGITTAFGQPATEPQAYLMHGPLVRRYARLPIEWKQVGR